MSKCLSFALYFISYLPLWASVIFIDIKSMVENGRENVLTDIISVSVILVVLFFSLIVVFMQLTPRGRENTVSYEIKTAKEQKTVTVDYLMSYILPLFAFEFTQWSGVLLFVIFFGTFWYLTVRHSIFSANIVLDLAQFRFYECRLVTVDKTEVEMTILSRRRLIDRRGETIYIKSLNNELKLDVN